MRSTLTDAMGTHAIAEADNERTRRQAQHARSDDALHEVENLIRKALKGITHGGAAGKGKKGKGGSSAMESGTGSMDKSGSGDGGGGSEESAGDAEDE